MNTTMKDIIHESRKKKRLTQEQLANILNVSNKTVSKWERGQGYPDILLIPKLCEALGISVSELFNCTDLAQDTVIEHDTAALSKYKNSAWLALLLYLCAFVFPIVAFLLGGGLLFVIASFIAVSMILASLVIFIMASLKLSAIMKEAGHTEGCAKAMKSFSGAYAFLYFIPLDLLPLLISRSYAAGLSLICYAVFAAILIWLIVKLRVKLLNLKAGILICCSLILLLIGAWYFAEMLITRFTVMHITRCVILLGASQALNYLLLFTSNEFRK